MVLIIYYFFKFIIFFLNFYKTFIKVKSQWGLGIGTVGNRVDDVHGKVRV